MEEKHFCQKKGHEKKQLQYLCLDQNCKNPQRLSCPKCFKDDCDIKNRILDFEDIEENDYSFQVQGFFKKEDKELQAKIAEIFDNINQDNNIPLQKALLKLNDIFKKIANEFLKELDIKKSKMAKEIKIWYQEQAGNYKIVDLQQEKEKFSMRELKNIVENLKSDQNEEKIQRIIEEYSALKKNSNQIIQNIEQKEVKQYQFTNIEEFGNKFSKLWVDQLDLINEEKGNRNKINEEQKYQNLVNEEQEKTNKVDQEKNHQEVVKQKIDKYEDLLKINQNCSELSVNLQNCGKITDQDLEKLNLGQFSNLKSLALDFQNCGKITDQGLEKLNLEKLSNLTSVALDFYQCGKITNQGLANLNLGNLSNLTSVTLNFRRCGKINDQGLANLNLKELPNLNNVSLKFQFTGVNQNLCYIVDFEKFQKVKQHF